MSNRPLTRPAPADENAGSGTPSPRRGHALNSGLAQGEPLQSRCVKALQHAQLRCAPVTIKFRVNLTPINAERQPSPLGRGCLAPALSSAGARRVRGRFVATGDCFPHFMQKPLWILYDQPIRDTQQPDPRSSQIVFFRRVLPHLARLRVSTTVKFDRQAMVEAIEIDNPVVDSALAPELCT